MPFLNISTYRFVALDDLPALRDRLEAGAQAAGLKGTILLAHEGINLFMAGDEAALRGWVEHALRAEPQFAGLPTKDSFSDTMPFRRLKVKIKNELIRMNHPPSQPQQGRAASVEPAALARWLAQGHDDAGRARACTAPPSRSGCRRCRSSPPSCPRARPDARRRRRGNR